MLLCVYLIDDSRTDVVCNIFFKQKLKVALG